MAGAADPRGEPLRLLLIEDDESDELLLVRELTRAGYAVDHQRVWTRDDLERACAGEWDLAISDWSMPGLNGLEAFSIVRSHQPDLPFIMVSGTISEEIAVDALKAGVDDFMSKGKFARLAPAIERVRKEAARHREEQATRDQLMISDRMASVGMLAAGVAHEINNPLAAVLANVDLASSVIDTAGVDPALAAELRELLDDARTAADRVRQIVRDLKIFSRHEEHEDGTVDVQHVLESTCRMAWNEIRHRAQLVKNYAETPPVRGSESRLGQVFLNLLVNAAQAMPEGAADRNSIRITTRRAGTRVVVEIADTGAGMSAETQRRLFTPFFTTKAVGEGTGLGLAIAYRIVTSLGGTIEVESEVGRGTTFRVSLPATEPAAPTRDVPAPTPRAATRARILVVDDETMICTTVQRFLSRHHDVQTATRAGDALQRIRGGEVFDVILCDLMMPQMTGMELHERLLPLGHAHRMVFMSGGAFSAGARQFLDAVPNVRLEKPFDRRQLEAAIDAGLRSTGLLDG